MLTAVLRRFVYSITYHYALLIYLQEDELYRQSAANFPHYAPPVEDVAPMEESFIGGFRHQQQPSSPRPPPLPPKDYPPYHQHGAQVSSSLPVPGPPTISTSQLTHMSAIERSKTQRVARMDPHLQVCVMCHLVVHRALKNSIYSSSCVAHCSSTFLHRYSSHSN